MYLRKSRVDIEAEATARGETLARHEKLLLEVAGATGSTSPKFTGRSSPARRLLPVP